jgi:hypothetical protein
MHGLHAIHFLKYYRRLAGAGCLSLPSGVRNTRPRSTTLLFVFQDTRRPGYPPGRNCDLCGKAFSSLNFLFAFCQLHSPSINSGGDDGTRTRGIRLAKAALSQLSYIPVLAGLLIFPVRVLLWAFQGSNLRPRPYQRRALTN